jgi:hypothetical protein
MIHSFTSLTAFENCPHQAYRKYVARDLPKEPASPEMTHGIAVHEAFERRLKAKAPFPPEYATYESFARVFDAAPTLLVEQMLGIRRDGTACDFFADDVWFRGKLDAATLVRGGAGAFMVDWKTGKKREKPDELEVFALLLKAHYPDLEKVTGHYIWLKDRQIGPQHSLLRPDKWAELQERCGRVERALGADFWPPREGPLCGWCPVKDCRFNPRRNG